MIQPPNSPQTIPVELSEFSTISEALQLLNLPNLIAVHNSQIANNFLSLAEQGIDNGDMIQLFERCKPQINNEETKEKLGMKIENIILEALRVNDRSIDKIEWSRRPSKVYNEIVSNLDNIQIPADIDFPEFGNHQKIVGIPSEELPPFWDNPDEEEEKEYEREFEIQLTEKPFDTIEDAGNFALKTVLREWKW